MFRTRDFVLVFTSVLFLVVAIGVTLWQQHKQVGEYNREQLVLVDTAGSVYDAKVAAPETLSREERLRSMREKISAGGEVVLYESATQSEELVFGEESDDAEVLVGAVVQYCSWYAPFSGSWTGAGATFEVSDGARLIYHEVEIPAMTASGTVVETIKNVLLQLPLRVAPTPSISCLPSDVVGVATDGSLIRNNEVGLYGLFGSNTLIGYALDGFPIYGVTDSATDICGGQMVNGQYGYYLSDDRDTILYCFSAPPVRI